MVDQYNIPNRAVTLHVVASDKINENTEYIEDALNSNYNLASQVTTKVDKDTLGVTVATLENGAGTIPRNQLPDWVVNNAFKVNTVQQMLQLPAHKGDIAVNQQTSKSYMLINDTPGNIDNWVAFATTSTVSQPVGNEPFVLDFRPEDWQNPISPSSKYTLTITPTEHKQGSGKMKAVFIKMLTGESIYPDYIVDSDGNVSLQSDSNFAGTLMISNLMGNCQNADMLTYSVYHGPLSTTNQPRILTYNNLQVTLNCDPEIVLTDGLGVINTINVSNIYNLDSTLASGLYYIFFDSDKINAKSLDALTVTPANLYSGIVDALPGTNLVAGRRAFLRNYGSYEYSGTAWIKKGYTPVALILIENSKIVELKHFPYNTNNLITTEHSTNKNNLFNIPIDGLDVSYNNSKIKIAPGSCLAASAYDNCNAPIMRLDSEFQKTLDSWQRGYGNGCLVESQSESFGGWFNIFLIYSEIFGVDLLITDTITPTLPLYFTDFRKIGIIKLDVNLLPLEFQQIGDKFLFEEIAEQVQSEGENTYTVSYISLVDRGVDKGMVHCQIYNSDLSEITIKSGNFLIDQGNGYRYIDAPIGDLTITSSTQVYVKTIGLTLSRGIR